MKRYKPNGKKLTEYEREILTILQEECAEVIQAASKLIRFGKENRPEGGQRNTEALGLEVGDMFAMVTRVRRAGLIRQRAIDAGVRRKRSRLKLYLQHSPGRR